MRKTILREYLSCSVQKTGGKITKYWRNETSSKIGHLAKAIAFAKWSVWVKNKKCQKHAKNHSRRTLALFCGKNSSEKTPNIGVLQNGLSWKGYSLCKMVSLDQELKMPKHAKNHFTKTVVLCKKPLEKTPKIGERRRSWKSAIFQRV